MCKTGEDLCEFAEKKFGEAQNSARCLVLTPTPPSSSSLLLSLICVQPCPSVVCFFGCSTSPLLLLLTNVYPFPASADVPLLVEKFQKVPVISSSDQTSQPTDADGTSSAGTPRVEDLHFAAFIDAYEELLPIVSAYFYCCC
jgi:hypothetical protein